MLQTLNRLKFIDPLSRINFDQNVNNNVWNCSTILYILNNLKRWQYNHIFGGCIYVSCSLGETWVNVISIGFIVQVVPILSSYFIYSFYCRYKKNQGSIIKHLHIISYIIIAFRSNKRLWTLTLAINTRSLMLLSKAIQVCLLDSYRFLSRTPINHREPVKKNSIPLRSSILEVWYQGAFIFSVQLYISTHDQQVCQKPDQRYSNSFCFLFSRYLIQL